MILNERNVEALAGAFEAMLAAWFTKDRSGAAQEELVAFAAEFFAARGVLAPGALTDDEAALIGRIPPTGPSIRGALSRIAKGRSAE